MAKSNARTQRASTACRREHLVGMVLALVLTGCGGYPEVSPAAFELAKAVNSLCNARNAEQIPAAHAIITEKHTAGEITDEEQEMLNDILDLAAGGQWERAERNARRLLADQTAW